MRLKRAAITTLILVLVLGISGATAAGLEQNLRRHVTYLADDAREGRGIGTKGLKQAADYIASQFEEIGLVPPFDGSYFQPFELGWGVEVGPENRVAFNGLTIDTATGIMPIGFSSAGTVSAPVVFVGYAITAPEYKYDDFNEVDVAGAIVLCMTGEPGEFDTTSVFEGLNYTAHATLRSKAGNAKLKGAAAMLVVEGPIYAAKGPEKLSVPRADEPYMDCGIPAVRITREAVVKLFPGFELEKLQRSIDSNAQPRSLSVTDTARVTVTADLTRQSVPVMNVAGLIPGSDTVMVVGAHYDHLGYGQSGSLEEKPGRIHNGADDNASGVAGVIECARMLKANPVRETVLAVAFTAEETGLGGSGHLVKHFPTRIDLVRAMLNLDMVGRIERNKLSVLGCNSAQEFKVVVDAANQDVGLEITCKGDGFGPSDNMPFYLAGRPVLFFFSGAHSDYHRSTDDVNKIQFDGLEKCTRLVSNIVRGLSKFGAPLTYVKSTEPPPQTGGRFRTYFGSIPDYAQPDTLIGILLSGVRPGSPAEQGGLRGGDLLVRMGEVKLNNIYDFVFALKRYAPGDSVEVRFMRDGKEKVSTAVLAPPRN